MARDIDSFPRVRLAHLPTPLEPMPRLSAALGGPPLWVKRDDATGLAFGGNKTRKLEYLMAEAREAGADTVITAGVVQSNHVRQTAAAAAKLGMGCHLVLLTGRVPDIEDDYEATGNILLDRLLGASVEFHEFDRIDRNVVLPEVAENLRRQGRAPFIIPYGGSNVTGTLGCVRAAREIAAQATDLSVDFQAAVFASGSAGTQAGFLGGFRLYAPQTSAIGIDIEAEPERLRRDVIALASDLAEALEADLGDLDAHAFVEPGYAGASYGAVTDDMRAAVELAARQEALILDPVYSGKAMAGLVGMVRSGAFAPDRPVLFIHTGGTPALFAYREAFG
jgi:L-cysteate sulfo-lyase